MASVTISGQPYEAYASLATADAYLAGSLLATAWRGETDDDQKGRALVEASRLIDRQTWVGSKLTDDQSAAWPRTGIEGVDDYAVPDEVVAATCELASAFIDGQTDVLTSATTANNTRRLVAGSVELEYFAPNALIATRFPRIVQELLGQFLAGSTLTGIDGATSYGVDECSSFSLGFDRNGPF